MHPSDQERPHAPEVLGLVFCSMLGSIGTTASASCPPVVIFIKEQGSQVQVGTHAALRKVSGKSCLTSSSDPCFTRGKLYVKILIICHFSTGTATIKPGALLLMSKCLHLI